MGTNAIYSYPSSPYYQTGQVYPATQTVDSPNSSALLKKMQARHFKEMGNELLRLHLMPQAVNAYENAILSDPSYTDAYFNLSQTFKMAGDIPKAAWWMTNLLFINPSDHDSRVLLGELYERMNLRPWAKRMYMQVLNAQPNFDPAKRNLNFLLYQDQMRTHPETGMELYKTTEKELVFKARSLIKQYHLLTQAPEERKKLVDTVPIVFEPTQVMDNTENIAEYDHAKGVIRIQPKMLFSSPNVVAAYLAHELIHAQDQDGETSIQEEQDGYRELVLFWQRFKNAEAEPNLDRALKLFEENPSQLDEEVKRLYTMRNPLIAEKSPGHGLPLKSKVQNAISTVQQRYNQYINERLNKWFNFKAPSMVGQQQFVR